MKKYPLEIKKLLEFEGGTDEPMAWYSKGHHDPMSFYDALIQVMPGFKLRRGEDIHHETWRAIPQGDFGLFTYEKCPIGGVRGSFPVTVVYL